MSGSTRFVDDVYTFYAVTTKFDTGVATDADAVPAYRVYEEETGTPILTGNMALLDSANTAGLYSEQITLSAANGFEVGKSYCVHIAATVNSVAGATVREFVVRKKPLTPTTEGRELDVTTTGEAGIDWANIGGPTTAQNLSGTNIKTDQVVASVSGAVGSVTGAVGSVTGNVTGSVGSLAAQAKADVNAEVLDVLNVDTFAQPGQATPAATTTIRLMLAYLYKAFRNRATQTASQYSLYNDDAVTVDQKATFSDDLTTADRGEVATGP